MSLDHLIKEINNNNLESAISIIEKIGLDQDYKAVPILINYLVSTENNILRDTIAVALADIGSTEAIEPLINLLKSPTTTKSRGTLLYALESFDCSSYTELIVDLLFEDGFEVSKQAFLLLEAQMPYISNEMKLKSIKRINTKIKDHSQRRAFLEDCVDLFEENIE